MGLAAWVAQSWQSGGDLDDRGEAMVNCRTADLQYFGSERDDG